MKGRLTAYAVCSGVMMLGAQSAFASVLIRPRVAIGYAQYRVDLPDPSASGGSSVVTSNYTSVGGGLTLAENRMYLDIYGSTNLHATHNWPGGFAGDFKRYDSALTAGYLLAGGWSVFAGYKYGVSEFYQATYPAYRMTFKATGPFIGANKVFRLSGGYSASISAAVASMSGKAYDTGFNNDSGTSVGLSLAATYNIPTGKTTGFQVKGYYQSYKYSGFSTLVNPTESILSAEVNYHINF